MNVAKLSFFFCFVLVELYTDAVANHVAANILLISHPFLIAHQRNFDRIANILVADGRNSVTHLQWRRKPTKTNSSAIDTSPINGTSIVAMEGAYGTDSVRSFVYDTIDDAMWKNETVIDHMRFAISGIVKGLPWQPIFDVLADRALITRLRLAKYNLAIVDAGFYPFSWIMAHILAIPYVTATPSAMQYYLAGAAGLPSPFSYVPSIIGNRTPSMSFFDRIGNCFDHLLFSASFLEDVTIAALRLFTPPIEIATAATDCWQNLRHDPIMTIILDDSFVEFPRPHSMGMVDSFGTKPRITSPLRDNVLSFVDDHRSKGTIVMSMSTMTDRDWMPPHMWLTFYRSFINFGDYRIVWRTGVDYRPSNSSNATNDSHIMRVPWLNITNAFGHNMTKLFISHGGQNGLLEAIANGVPTLSIPMAGDNYGDAARVKWRGIGITLHKSQLTTTTLTEAIKRLLESSKITRNANRMMSMVDDRRSLFADPLKWHIDYAVRHWNIKKTRIKAQGEHRRLIDYFNIDLMCAPVIIIIWLSYSW